MKKLIFGLLILLFVCCSEKPKTEFSLIGTTSDVENGTVLYLDNTEVLIDSVAIENNSFRFTTKLSKSPLQVILRTRNFSHYRFLWLENKPMTFDATQSDFRNASVTGSNEENLSQALMKETDSLPEDERFKLAMEFVDKNPNSAHSAYIVSVYSKNCGKEKSTKSLD